MNVKVACDEWKFEDVSLTGQVQRGEGGAASLLQMQQNLHLSCSIQNQQDGAELDSLCLPFFLTRVMKMVK
jgi:hypothetical protein